MQAKAYRLSFYFYCTLANSFFLACCKVFNIKIHDSAKAVRIFLTMLYSSVGTVTEIKGGVMVYL